MSTVPNAFGNALGTATPFFALSAVGTNFGSFVKPGGRVAAYVRSTGFQDLDDNLVRDNLVTSINEGLKRCRSGFNDVVFVLPGHAETYSSSGAIWANLVAGAQIVGCASPGQSNAPTLTLSNAGASVALNVANVTVCGLNFASTTAALTSAFVFSAAGCTFAQNFVLSTGTGGANSLVQVTSAPQTQILGNHIVTDSTSAILAISGATSTDLLIGGNLIRQRQGTSGGAGISIANTAGISGFAFNNFIASATNLGAGNIDTLITYAGTNPVATFFCFENYGSDNGGSATANAGKLIPDVNADA